MSMDADEARRVSRLALLRHGADLAKLVRHINDTGHLTIDDRSESDIPRWVPKPVIMDAWALAHGIRRRKGHHIVRSIREYLRSENPRPTLLTVKQAKARLREYSRTMFPVMPMVTVRRGANVDNLQHFLAVWEANPPNVFVISWMGFLAFYWFWVSVGNLASVDYRIENPIFYDMAMWVVCSLLVAGFGFAYHRVMMVSGPPAVYLIDFAHFLRLMVFAIILDIAFMSRAAMFEGRYSPAHRQHLVGCHLTELCYLTGVCYAKGAFKQRQTVDQTLFAVNFLFMWLDVCSTFGASFAYAGGSEVVQGIYFAVVVVSLFAWVGPMLFGVVSTRAGMMRHTLLFVLCIDGPVALLGLLATDAEGRSGYINFDLGFKAFQILRLSRIVARIVAEHLHLAQRWAELKEAVCVRGKARCIAAMMRPLRKLWARIRCAWCDDLQRCITTVRGTTWAQFADDFACFRITRDAESRADEPIYMRYNWTWVVPGRCKKSKDVVPEMAAPPTQSAALTAAEDSLHAAVDVVDGAGPRDSEVEALPDDGSTEHAPLLLGEAGRAHTWARPLPTGSFRLPPMRSPVTMDTSEAAASPNPWSSPEPSASEAADSPGYSPAKTYVEGAGEGDGSGGADESWAETGGTEYAASGAAGDVEGHARAEDYDDVDDEDDEDAFVIGSSEPPVVGDDVESDPVDL